MLYSIVFLNYDPKKVKAWTKGTLEKVIDCSKGKDYELIEINDVLGYANAVNEGIKKSKGEYVFILNDDIILEDNEWLEKMAKENAITSWRKNPFYMNQELVPDGACYCIHSNVIRVIGLLDPQFGEGYGCDEIDYFYRAKEAGFDLLEAPVKLSHMENRTYQSEYFKAQKEAMTMKNVELFYQKWKDKMELKP